MQRKYRHPDLNFGKVFGPKDGRRYATVTHRVSGKPLYRLHMDAARVWCYTPEDFPLATQVGTLGEVRDAISRDWFARERRALASEWEKRLSNPSVENPK